MVQNLAIVSQIVELGLIMSFVGLGAFISGVLLHFNDLSIEGSFACGAAVSIVFAKMGVGASGQFVASLVAGAVVGLLTSVLHFRVGINKIIAGLLSAGIAFSINLKLVGPHALMPAGTSLFSGISFMGDHHKLIKLMVITAGLLFLIGYFLKSQLGLLLRASGDNPVFVRSLGKNAIGFQTAGLMLANGLAGVSGHLFTAFTGFFSITGSVGILPIALAGIILSGMSSSSTPFKIILGSVLYQLAITMCINLNIDPGWNKLVTAVIVLALILIQKAKSSERIQL